MSRPRSILGRVISSTWESRDLPVLVAAVELCDDSDQETAMLGELGQRSGLSEGIVGRALRALAREDPPFFDGITESDWGIHGVAYPTGHARRTVGAWPTPELLASRLVAELKKAAEKEPDEGLTSH